MRALWTFARGLAVLYVLVCVLAWIFQRRLMYLPDTGDVATPSDASLPGIQAVDIEVEDGVTVKAWYRAGDGRGTVLFFHGNAGHRGHRLPVLRALAARGYGVMLPDYRGYGGSTGSPSEDGLYADGEACRAWLAEHDRAPLILMGSSLGSGVAVELATREAPAALVLQSPFDTMVDVAASAYPFLPVRFMLWDRYESLAKIASVKTPLFVAHGTSDRIIPTAAGRRLFDAANEPKRWFPVEGAGHNDLLSVAGEAYWDAIDAFLAEHRAR